MISNIIILLIAISAFMHKGINKYSLLCFAGLYGGCNFISSNIEWGDAGRYYYLLSGIVSIGIIYALTKISRPNNIVTMICSACLCFIYFNLFGWVLYEMYIGPIVYNIACALLFLAVLLSSNNTRISNDLGNNAIHNNSSVFRGSPYQGAFVVNENKKAQKS